MGAFLDEYTDNMQLKAVISGQNGDYGNPPGDVSVMLHCSLALHYFRDGGFYPRGGGQAISDALAASVERNGGTVHLRRPVRRIVVDPITGAAQGVQLEPRGDTPPPMVKAKVVLSAADLEHTLTSLLDTDALKPEEAAKVDGATGWEVMRRVILPNMKAAIMVAVLFRTNGRSRRSEAGGKTEGVSRRHRTQHSR